MTALEIAHEEDTLIWETPPRYGQVVKALAMLAGNNDLWEAAGQAAAVDAYLAARVPGDYNPLRDQAEYRPFQHAVADAAAVLRIGGA